MDEFGGSLYKPIVSHESHTRTCMTASIDIAAEKRRSGYPRPRVRNWERFLGLDPARTVSLVAQRVGGEGRSLPLSAGASGPSPPRPPQRERRKACSPLRSLVQSDLAQKRTKIMAALAPLWGSVSLCQASCWLETELSATAPHSDRACADVWQRLFDFGQRARIGALQQPCAVRAAPSDSPLGLQRHVCGLQDAELPALLP